MGLVTVSNPWLGTLLPTALAISPVRSRILGVDWPCPSVAKLGLVWIQLQRFCSHFAPFGQIRSASTSDMVSSRLTMVDGGCVDGCDCFWRSKWCGELALDRLG